MQSSKIQIEVFCSYAHADEQLCRELEKHLSPLQRMRVLSSWYDRRIVPGTDWANAIDTHLNSASIILLLISPDFFASDYCYGIEMQRALERHQVNEARVIPVLLRPVDWRGAPFEQLEALPTNAKPITTWHNKDQAFADVAAGIRRVIEDLSLLPCSIASVSWPSVWNIPYPRNLFFTDREDVLSQLVNAFRINNTMALTRLLAISGLGGVGKTQIVVEYAYRYYSDYHAVLWAQAETREMLISAFVTLAELLNLPQKDAQDQLLAVAAVKKWMTAHTKWLLILDNADDLEMVREFIPPAFAGHLLLTTRAQVMGKLARSIEVETMTPKDGTLFLLRRAGIIASDAPLTQVAEDETDHAMELVRDLGGLPLALDQAGAYIEESQCSIRDYLRFYRRQRTALLKRRGGLIADHPKPVATTWSISFQEIEECSPAAADLLRLCAFLSPDDIPEEFLTEGASQLGPHLQLVTTNPFVLNEAITALRAFSLIRRNGRNNTLSCHRLVQAVLKDAMSEETYKQWAERTVRAVNKTFPEVDFDTWPRCERCLPHAQICAVLIEQGGMRFPEGIQLLDKMGHYLQARAQYTEAETFYRQALTVREQQLGPDHPDIATDLNSLAMLCFTQGKYAEAETLNLRALQIREQQLGPDHPGTATILNNLGSIYNNQGKQKEAESLYQRALKIKEQQLGADHRSTVSSLFNLAGIYHNLGKHAEAKPLDERLLTIYERRVKTENSKDAFDLYVLAGFYKEQGRDEEAMLLYQQALTLNEQRWGPDHPQTADNLNSLANLYETQGQYATAEQLYQRALAIFEEKLGADHRLTTMVVKNYIDLLRKAKREAEAIQLEERFKQ